MKAMMKALCVTAALSLLCTAVYAEALRSDPKRQAQAVSRMQKGDLYYEDFAATEPGSMPKSVKGVMSAGTLGLADYETGSGVTKACLEMVDTDYSSDYTGGSATFSLGTLTDSRLMVTMRFKQLPGENSSFNSGTIELRGGSSNAIITRLVASSSNGGLGIQIQGNVGVPLQSNTIDMDTWYTVTWLVDLEEQNTDCRLLNEGTGRVATLLRQPYYSGGVFDSLNNITLNANVYAGTWVVDYVRVSTASLHLDEMDEMNIKPSQGVKPAPTVAAPAPHILPGRINIAMNGLYRYTTAQPTLSQTGEVMVTPRDAALIFGAAYSRDGSGCLIQKGSRKILISQDGKQATMDGQAAALAQDPAEGTVSLKDLAGLLGYGYSYSPEEQLVQITPPKTAAEGGTPDEKA